MASLGRIMMHFGGLVMTLLLPQGTAAEVVHSVARRAVAAARVESAIYTSTKDEQKFADVTDQVRRLIRRYGVRDFTGKHNLNEIFGDPAWGEAKALRITSGNTTVTLEEGPRDAPSSAFDLTPLVSDFIEQPKEVLDEDIKRLIFDDGENVIVDWEELDRVKQMQQVEDAATTECPLPLLFVGIYTAPTKEGAERRAEIRDTYWQHPLLQGPCSKIQAKFIVGSAVPGSKRALKLEEEIKSSPKDFLRLSLLESYATLSTKTMALMRWFALNQPAQWLLKLDDDTFPHFNTIEKRLSSETSKYIEMGLMFNCAPVLKETKWAEDPTIYNHSYFPPYMQGSGYFLTADLVHELADIRYEKNLKKLLHNEDAAIGVWIRMKKEEEPDWQVELKESPSTLTGCSPDDMLSMNNQPGYMRCYWGRYLRGEQDVCCYGPLNALTQSFLQRRSTLRARRRRQGEACFDLFDTRITEA